MNRGMIATLAQRAFLMTLAATFASVASIAYAAEKVVWQIGKPDKSYKEFAVAGRYNDYAEKFGRKPVVFEIGKSDAARDWPYIQPGPVDHWAGGGAHPFTIRFSLADEPKGVFTLRIELVNTHYEHPPLYKIMLSGRSGQYKLPLGASDASLANPAAGKPHKIEIALPANLLQKGKNEITLTGEDGSWVLYDAVTLLNDPDGRMPEADIQSLTATATPFFIRADGKTRRAVDVTVALTAPAPDLSLRVEAGGETIEVPVTQLSAFGAVRQEVGVPDSPKPLEVKVIAQAGGHSKATTVTVEPQRKWRIYVASSSHTDIGYTDIQPKCAERHNQNLDVATSLCAQYPDFKWNLEVACQAENYLATRPQAQREKFLELAKEGRIGVQALHNNILTGLCSPESACRLVYYAHSLKTRYGIPFKSAMISDVPTQEASIPTILANAGIRYFSSGINNDRAYTFTKLQDKCPCWWEGPDGSRVMMMYTRQYAQASQWALTQSLDAARARILANLAAYEKRVDYPYDAVFLHGAVSDNQPLNIRIADVVKSWNERYEYPKIIHSCNAEFFEYIEKNYSDKLPVVRGSAGVYWEDGAGSSAYETALCRNAKETVGNAEKLLAMARRLKSDIAYPAEAFYSAWRNCLYYDEHTWGAHCSISKPDSDFTKDQWKIKAQFAMDADRESKALLAHAKKELASLVKSNGPALVVCNPMSWARTDVMRVSLPAGFAINDPRAVACDDGQQGTLLLVKDLPPCGYLVLKLEKSSDISASAQSTQPTESTQSTQGSTIESRFYRVTFDPATGAIKSLFDKEINRELADPKAPYRLNQYLYVAGGKGSRIVMNANGPQPQLAVSVPEKATLRRVKLGTIGERMTVETSAQMTPKIIAEITVWNDIKRVDIVNRLTKTQTYDKEAAYFAFPFAAQKPTFRYECPAGIVNANKDMLPGACLDWFCVQHFVEIESGDAAIAWATPDAPLVCFQDINRGKWQTALPFETGHLYAYVMNNYWHTNYKAGQGGDFTFRFSITSRAKADSAASARFGWAAANPLMILETSGSAAPAIANAANAPLPATAASLMEVAEPNVILIGAKKAETGDALILRLWEVTGQATTAHIRLGSTPATKATACNLVEEPASPLEIKDGAICVPLRASGLATVMVE
ncbi:MAG: polysaccharide lyase family protein [Candidatus Sumerlaeota bacterium]|nr:polysaccharide lyase family protein [Candidatus Sumerlaeota bacterium]